LLLSASALADDLLLAPGKSITILDAADPSVRVVITAPPDAPLNLSTLLVTDPKESVYSIVTRMQLDPASGLSMNADGSLALSPAAVPPAQSANMLQGGVLVFSAGKYTLHPAAEPAPPQATPAAAAPSPGEPGPARLLISKPGVGKDQAERDIAQCRGYAESASAQFIRRSEKAAMYNMAMRGCLKGFGYEVHTPAA
jgi:hypothetical protein